MSPLYRALGRSRRALLVLATLVACLVPGSALAQSTDCGQSMCAWIRNAPERAPSGGLVTFNINYTYREGFYPDGITIHLDAPEYFVANAHPSNDVWQPYLIPPSGPATPAVCTVVQTFPWRVQCGVKRSSFTVSDNVNNGVITVAMHSQAYDTPDDYPAEFKVTISGNRTFPINGGPTQFVTHTDSATVFMYGEANPLLGPASGWTQYLFPADEPDLATKRGRSEGLTMRAEQVINVANWSTAPDAPAARRVRPFSMNQIFSNAIPRPNQYNSTDFNSTIGYDPPAGLVPGSGDLYWPELQDDDHFETDVLRPLAATPGSNALYDVRYELTVPSWIHVGDTLGLLLPTTTFSTDKSIPARGSAGGFVAATLVSRFGQSSPIAQAVYPAAKPSATASPAIGNTSFHVQFYIPCDVDLDTIDSDRTKPGTQLSPDKDLFELRLTAKQKRYVPDPGDPEGWMLDEVEHIVEYAPFNALSALTLTACTEPSIGSPGANTKTVSFPGVFASHHSINWTNLFRSLTNWTGDYGDVAIVDAIPPFNEVKSFSTWTGGATPHETLGAPWLCVLPRTNIIGPKVGPNFDGRCPDATATYHLGAGPPWNSANPHAECNSGAPMTHIYDPDGLFFDPLPLSMDVPYDPSNPDGGLEWNPTLQRGCLRATEVCDHATAYRNYGTCTPGENGKLAMAHQITHVMWRSQNGWRHGTDALGLPTAPAALSATLSAWTTQLNDPSLPYPMLDYEDRRVAWTTNVTRFFGGAFDPDGDGPIPTQRLDSGSVTVPGATNPVVIAYNTTLYASMRIDNRWNMSTTLFPATTTVPRGTSALIDTTASVISIGSGAVPPRVGGVRAQIDLPPGFDPGSGSLSDATHQRIPVTVPPNPAGVSGTLPSAVSFARIRFDSDPLPTINDLAVELLWVGSPTDPNNGHWRYLVSLSDTFLSRGWTRSGGNTSPGVQVAAVPRSDFPFVDLAPNQVRITAAAPSFDRTDDNNFDTWSDGDTGDFVTATMNLLVPMLAEVKVVAVPFCVPGRTAPSFMVTYHNVGGVDQYGARVVFQVPESVDGVALVFAGVHEEAAWRPPNTNLTVEVSTTTRDAIQLVPPIVWTPLASFSGAFADIKLVRVRYEDAVVAANKLPAWYANARYRVDLATPTATLADIGKSFTTTGYIGTQRNGQEIMPLAASEPSQPFYLGQCPGRLQVTKFYDADRDGDLGDGDYPLSDWGIELAVAPGQSLTVGNHVDNSTRSATTDGDGNVFFDVWPGQVPTLTEDQPAPEDVDVPAFPGTTARLSWAATTPGGASKTLPAIAFTALAQSTFGNACTCTSTNLCIATTCLPPTSGAEAATCEIAFVGPDTCDTPELCGDPVGFCDPSTGECAYPEVACEEHPTRIYVVIDDDAGNPVGSVICEVDEAAATLVCATRQEGDTLVLDVQEVLVCAP